MTRRTRLTTRAALLGVVLVALVLTLAYPLRVYLAQRGQIQNLAEQNKDSQARVEALRKAVKRYDDPGWVRDQARLRLHYTGPDERIYVVGQTPTPHPAAPTPTGRPTAGLRPSASPSSSGAGLSNIRRLPVTASPTASP